MSDSPLVTVDMLLDLHSGLEVLKERQTEINRRIGNLERTLEVEPESWATRIWGWFLQAVVWGIGITSIVVLGSLFGVEVRW